jgi:hypothetical protein
MNLTGNVRRNGNYVILSIIQSAIQNCGGSLATQAKQINFEMVLEIAECVICDQYRLQPLHVTVSTYNISHRSSLLYVLHNSTFCVTCIKDS